MGKQYNLAENHDAMEVQPQQKPYYPKLHLTTKNYPPLKGKKVGDKCMLIVEGQVTSMTEDIMDKNARYTIDMMKASPYNSDHKKENY